MVQEGTAAITIDAGAAQVRMIRARDDSYVLRQHQTATASNALASMKANEKLAQKDTAKHAEEIAQARGTDDGSPDATRDWACATRAMPVIRKATARAYPRPTIR